MKRYIFVLMMLTGIALVFSCNSSGGNEERGTLVAENRIMQQSDGTISLKIDKAECYHDVVNPSINTAEWSVVVSKSGRYDVWLSSATRDTTDLKFKNNVLLSIRDNRLEAKPVVDRIIQNSSDVKRPYYQADSFMGSLYIQDTGVYSVQVISDKVLPPNAKESRNSEEQTKIVSVSIKPAVKH
jgi:hypothetical protein